MILLILAGAAMLFVAMLPVFVIAYEVSKPRPSCRGGFAE